MKLFKTFFKMDLCYACLGKKWLLQLMTQLGLVKGQSGVYTVCPSLRSISKRSTSQCLLRKDSSLALAVRIAQCESDLLRRGKTPTKVKLKIGVSLFVKMMWSRICDNVWNVSRIEGHAQHSGDSLLACLLFQGGTTPICVSINKIISPMWKKNVLICGFQQVEAASKKSQPMGFSIA